MFWRCGALPINGVAIAFMYSVPFSVGGENSEEVAQQNCRLGSTVSLNLFCAEFDVSWRTRWWRCWIEKTSLTSFTEERWPILPTFAPCPRKIFRCLFLVRRSLVYCSKHSRYVSGWCTEMLPDSWRGQSMVQFSYLIFWAIFTQLL